jgi:hypothetical protein
MKIRNIIFATSLCFVLLPSCTDVEEKVYDKYASEEFFGSPEGAAVALAGVYSQIGGNWNGVGYAGADNGWYDLNMMSTDEQVIPHRKTGDWQLDFARIHKHNWLPTDYILNNTWNWLYTSIFKANLAIEQLESANAEPSKIAEARVLRAFFYYLLMDDFGNVPFYTKNDITVNELPQVSRQVVYDFVVKELTENVDKLSSTKGGDFYGRFNIWAGYSLLAKVYLNAEVYTGTSQWDEALAACNKVMEGGFSLHPGRANPSSPLGFQYYELFGESLPEDETILAIFVRENVVSRNIYGIRSLHGPHALELIGYNGWNGTIVPTDYYELYTNADIRKKQFIVGQQPGGVEYTLNVESLDDPGADRTAGVRNLKFYPAPPMDGNGASNDFPIYRYADIMLMKAECLVRLGNAADAKPLVDEIRVRAGLTQLAGNPTLENIYLERSLELNWEGHRRQDMIRFGTFLLANEFRGESEEYKKLFPIPTAAIDANPGLDQNFGY